MRQLRAFRWCLVLALWTVAPSVLAETSEDALPAIQHIEAMGAQARDLAADARARADGWRKLESDARTTAEGVTDPALKKSWQDDAERYKKNAEDADTDAARLDGEAAKAEAEAKQRRSASLDAPPPSTASPEAQPSPASNKQTARADNFFGYWRDTRYETPVVIGLKYPDNPASREILLLETKQLKWTGVFKPGSDTRLPHLSFQLMPRWEQMNPEIPEWARRELEDKLEWKLEIEPPDAESLCVCYDLKATWYPGEVHWSEQSGARNVSVAGPGDPIAIKLERADEKIDLAGYYQPRVIVYTDNPAIARTNPVKSLTKLQRFHIEALLPREEADRLGPTILAKVRASSGDEDSVELTANSGRTNPLVVRYAHSGDVTIADIGTEANRRSTLGPIPALNYGDRLAMSVSNGDEITVSIEGAEQSFKIYNSWIQQGIEQHVEAFDKMADVLNAVLSAPKKSFEQRRESDQKLQLIRHAKSLLTEPHHYQDSTSDFWLLDHERYWVGKVYERLLFSPDHHWYSVERKPPVLSPWGFYWASPEEALEVSTTIATKREQYMSEAVTDLSKAGTYALYSFVANSSPVGDIFVLVRGVDLFGNPVDLTERFQAGLRIGVAGLVQGLVVYHNVSTATSSGRINRLGARAAIKESVILGRARVGGVPSVSLPDVSGISAPAPTAGPTLTPEPTIPVEEAATGCVVLPTEAGAEAGSGAALDAAITKRMQEVHPKAEIIDAPPELHVHKQVGGTCRLVAQEVQNGIATGDHIKPVDGNFARQELRILPESENPVTKEVIKMNSTEQMRSWANAIGGKAWSYNLSTRELIGFYEDGFRVTVTVYIENEGFHQISLVNVEYDLLGRPTKLAFHDSNFPTKLAKYRVCDFDSVHATPSMRAPESVATELPNGKVVKTLEMKTLGHPNVDLSRYDAGN